MEIHQKIKLKSCQQKAKKKDQQGVTLQADTSVLDSAALFQHDLNLNNNFDDDDDFNGRFPMGPMGDTNFGDQDLLSGKLYVSKQSGAVEG